MTTKIVKLEGEILSEESATLLRLQDILPKIRGTSIRIHTLVLHIYIYYEDKPVINQNHIS